jgi:hypothetical protein
MADSVLDPLQPELMGGLFGRKPSLVAASVFAPFQPRTRFLLIALVTTGIVLLAAVLDHCLTNPKNVQTALALLLQHTRKPSHIGLPLLQDPIALITIVMTLVAPIFCSEQVRAIQGFNAMNECNISYRVKQLDAETINSYTAAANGQFRLVGSRWISSLLFFVSALLSLIINYLIWRWGLFASWNHTRLSVLSWRREVYAGWWANIDAHRPLAIILGCIGCYFFYFVIKQLLMGGIFSVYVHRVMPHDFGVAPNMAVNSDGYWGLRLLRHFMQMTYASTLGHLIVILGVLLIWLPFSAFTILIVTTVIIANALVVVYPSAVALTGVISEKKRFVAYLQHAQFTPQERTTMIDKIWSLPNLPFKGRSTLTAATVYLLIPLILALVSSLLGKLK